MESTVYIKTYVFINLYQQCWVLLTMVPRNSGMAWHGMAWCGVLVWLGGRAPAIGPLVSFPRQSRPNVNSRAAIYRIFFLH